jgi:WD40 repeat protein/serine/threonine protein kinase
MQSVDEETVFNAAKDLKDPSAVGAYLDSVCASDPDLRRRIERLLALQERAQEFFRFDAFPDAVTFGSVEGKPTVLSESQDQDPAAVWDHPLRRFGDYELLEEIARGGMGVVYKARQVSLDRLVAIKTLLLGSFSGKESIQRFRVEASAAASLRHPNIVAVHEVGVHEDEHYLVMDYIPGPTLSRLCAGQPLAPKRAAAYARKIAEAVHFAHEHGVLHRDLKPSNVLIDQDDQPHVTDFGLAKRQDKDSELTLSGQVLGTPSYMAPEQASGKRGLVGPYTDVYSLGAILFHLLTGRPPFVAENIHDTLQMVLEQEPITPRSLVMGVPRDLDTICLKCLRKEPGKRYGTAQELAEELGRFLNQEPIHARRTTQGEKLWRWCRRRPAMASLAAATTALTLAVVIGSPIAVYRINGARAQSEKNLYFAKINLMERAWQRDNVHRVRQLLSETASYPERGFEWYYWQLQAHLELKTLSGHRGPVLCVAYSPDGERVLTGSDDHTARLWDAVSGKELLTLTGHRAGVMSVAFSPDGERIVTGSADHTAKIWNSRSGKEILTLWGHQGGFVYVAWSPDGKLIVTGSDIARVWDATSGKRLITLSHKGSLRAVAFSPDGGRIVTGSDDKTAKVWETASGKELSTLAGHRLDVVSIAFSADGKRIVTGSEDGTIRVWDAVSFRQLFVIEQKHNTVDSVGFSPDGRRIVSVGGGDETTARFWDALTGKPLFTLKGDNSEAASFAFSPDGQHIITASGYQSHAAKIWNAFEEDRASLVLATHQDSVHSIVFSADGQRIVTGSDDKTAKVWDAATGNELSSMIHTSGVTCVTISHNGQHIATASRTARVWDATSGKTILTLGPSSDVNVITFSPDDQRIATGTEDGRTTIWEAFNGRKLVSLQSRGTGTMPLAFSPDGQVIVVGYDDGSLEMSDALTGKELHTFKAHDRWIVSVAFSPDGKRFVTGAGDGIAKVWDTATTNLLLKLEGQGYQVWGVVYSPDGRRIATGGEDGTVKIWEAASGAELLSFKGHTDSIRSIAFSPDGTRLATASWDHTAKVWLTATKQQVNDWDRAERAAVERTGREEQALAEVAERDRAERVQAPGAIKEWLVLAPIRVEGHSAYDLAQEQILKEQNLHPRAGEHTRVGTNDLFWSAERLQDYEVSFGKIRQIYANRSEGALAYAVSYIESDLDQTNLCALIGNSRFCNVFLNGKEIYQQHSWADYFPDADLVTGLALKHGLNVLVMKVTSDTPAWFRASIRFTDADGQPLKGIKVTLSIPTARMCSDNGY